MMTHAWRWICLALVILAALPAAEASPFPLDALTFGDAASERRHQLVGAGSDIVSGGLGEPARRLLPPATPGWEGGRVAFTLQVDPVKLNYCTVRFWGSEASQNRLLLFCEGKQIGYGILGTSTCSTSAMTAMRRRLMTVSFTRLRRCRSR